MRPKDFVIITLLATGTTNAEVYKWTDAAGNVHFSDSAPKSNPDLAPITVLMNTPIALDKPKKAAAVEQGPNVIVIGDSGKPASHCNTKTMGGMSDVWQTHFWKDCRGMK